MKYLGFRGLGVGLFAFAAGACSGGGGSTTDTGVDTGAPVDGATQDLGTGSDVISTPDVPADSMLSPDVIADTVTPPTDGSGSDVPPGDSGNPSINQYTGLQANQSGADAGGPAVDILNITINHTASTFTAVDTTMNAGLSGTFMTLPSGFLQLTVTAGCQGAGCTPGTTGTFAMSVIGNVSTALEAPGYFLVAVGNNGGTPLFAVAANNCSAGTFAAYNAINIGFPPGYDLTTNAAYGSLALSGTASSVGVNFMPDTISGMAMSPSTVSGGTCSQGVTTLTLPMGGTVTVVASGNGVVFANSGEQNPNTLGLQQSAMALAGIENQTYSGISGGSDGGGGQAIQVVFGAAPTGVATPYTDVATNTLDPNVADVANVTFTGDANGLLTGTILNHGVTGTVVGAAFAAGAVTIIALVGNAAVPGDGGATTNNSFNAILVSH